MNILLTTLVFPYPVNDGGKSGTYRMIDSLRKNNKVTLICPQPQEEHLAALKKLWPEIEILTFKIASGPAKKSFLVRAAKRILGRNYKPTREEVMKQQMLLTSCNLVDFYFEDLIHLFKMELDKRKYDLVQIDFIELAPLVHFIPKELPKVFVHHEIRFKRMERELATLVDPEDKYRWKMANTKLLELELIDQFDKVICLTETDKQILVDAGMNPAKVVASPLPMVVSPHNINQPFVSENRLLFLGPDQHYPNLDGLYWFLKNCWAELQNRKPDLKLIVVGKWSEEKRKWFANYQNVSFEGFVPDLATVMKGSIMIVPLRIGSGMRMKILEGVSYNVPIISTSIGAEGLPMENNVNCKIVDLPAGFVDAVIEVLDHPELQSKFIKNASNSLIGSFSSEDCGNIREEIYSSLVTG